MNMTEIKSFEMSTEGARRRYERNAGSKVLLELEQLCDRLPVGDRIPPHKELMRQFNASQRTVLKAIQELTKNGRLVRRQRSGTYIAEHARNRPAATNQEIASIVLVAQHDNAFYAHVTDLIYRYAEVIGLPVRFELPHFERLIAINDIHQRGFLVLGSSYPQVELCERLHQRGHRAVLMGDPDHHKPMTFACVHADNYRGGYLAAKHLIDLGHRRLAEVMTHEDTRRLGRQYAVKEACEAGNPVTLDLIALDTYYAWKANPELALAYFRADNAPTGLCVWNDFDCIHLMTFMQSNGIRVPEQVSLIGYDNLPISTNVTPALTTMDMRVNEQIKLAMRMLIEDPTEIPRHSAALQPELVVRASTQRQGN